MLTYFQSAMEETNRVELDNGAVESTGTSVQIERLRRSSKEVTSIPRPKRCKGANNETSGGRNIPYRGIACAKVLWWERASELYCVRSREKSICSEIPA